MCLYYDYHTSKSFPPFSPSKLSHIPLLATFEINDLFFHYCCYMHICMCTCISKYNLFNLHVFRAGHFLVDNQLVYSYLNKIISLIHRIPYFSVFFLCRIEALWSPCPHPLWHYFDVILVHFIYRQSYWWIFWGAASEITRRHMLTTNSLISVSCDISTLFPAIFPEIRCMNCFVDVCTGTRFCILIG